MFDDILKDGIEGLKTLIGRVVAVAVVVIIGWLAGLGITVPGDTIIIVEPTSTPVVEPTPEPVEGTPEAQDS